MNSEIVSPVFTEELETLIRSRRSIRKFKSKSVSRMLIDRIVDAGKYAPSALNRQPWNFYILTDVAVIKHFSREIARASLLDFAKSGVNKWLSTAADLFHSMKFNDLKHMEDPVFHGAPVVVFITAPRNNGWGPLDVGMCAQNMMLMAHASGLATCPVGFAKLVEQVKDYPLLRIPKDEHVILALVIGYADEAPEAHERKSNAVFYLNGR